MEVLDRELARVERYGDSVSICFVDIDRFKSFNDRFGHVEGDQVLKRTAALLERGTRSSDVVFRYGGEEFVVMLPSTPSVEAGKAAAHLIELLRTENVYRPPRGEPVPVSVSIGIATAPSDATSRGALITCADRAMYQAKADGRDRFMRYSELPEAKFDAGLLGTLPPSDSIPAGPPSHGRGVGHTQRVTELCLMLAHDLGLTRQDRVNLRVAAMLHDIGELAVPTEVLDKTEPLTDEERVQVEQHPAAGASFLRASLRLSQIILAVRHHHERFGGGGYPDGLSGTDIPILARIIAVAEVFDALTQERPYRDRITAEDAYAVLREVSGSQLDPNLVERFVEVHSGT